MGLLNSLSLTPSEYKKLSQQREKYMEDALLLKEEMERKKSTEEDDEDEDDDDDEDEDDDDGNGVSRAVVVTNGEATHEESADATNDGQSKPEGLPSTEANGDSHLQMNGHNKIDVSSPPKIGKETDYDDFCADIPTAPELIRRCLAVLRTLSVSGPAEPFLYPVDPQNNPGYYDMVLRPMCLREVGKQLKDAAAEARGSTRNITEIIENTVTQFGRNIRLIG